METKADLRQEIATTVGLSLLPATQFRKDHLNAILSAVGGESIPGEEVYQSDGPGKVDLYYRLAEEAGFDYDSTTPRPLRRDELEKVRSAVE